MQSLINHSAALTYMETKEWPIAGREEQFIPASEWDRFGICLKSEVSVTFRMNGVTDQKILVAAGEMFYVQAGHSVVIRSYASTETKLVFISFQADHFMVQQGEESDLVTHCFRMPQMKNWISEFQSYEKTNRVSDFFLMQSRLYALASAFMKQVHKPIREMTEITGFVEETRQGILGNYESAIDMEEVARTSGAGSSRFYKTFRRLTGLSPHKYLIATRLNASLRLLADPSVSVTEAAHSVGYSDEYYFSRLFKKHMGIAPTEYSLRAQISIAVLTGVFVGDLTVLGISPKVTLMRDWMLDISSQSQCLEEIRRSQPDYILTAPLSEELLQELTAIAPVEVYHWHEYSWKERFSEFGRLLNLESVAERWLLDYERKTDNARQQVEERWPNIPYLIVGIREGTAHELYFRVYGKQKRKFTDLLYDELRIKAPEAANKIGFMDTTDLQDIIDLGSDHVLFLLEFPADKALCMQLEQQWKNSQEQSGHERKCIFIHLDEPFIYNSAMHERLVDQIVKYLYSDKRVK